MKSANQGTMAHPKRSKSPNWSIRTKKVIQAMRIGLQVEQQSYATNKATGQFNSMTTSF